MARTATMNEPAPSRHSVAGARSRAGKAVVVHSGARDGYQVAQAFAEAGLLEALVSDLYWPADRQWARALLRFAPSFLRAQLLQRSARALPSRYVQPLAARGLATLLLDKWSRAPFSWRRAMMRSTDAALGRGAGKLARRTHATIVSYSYYGYHAFREYPSRGLLFQLHPHPASMRTLLRRELAAHPDCADSLMKEWELALPEQDFERLVRETAMAAHYLAASSFTRQTLIENGTPPEAVSVVPYGVDCNRFSPTRGYKSPDGTLRLLFVGRINQRKGIKYLLQALRLLHRRDVHLSVCGRVVDGLDLFQDFNGQVEVHPSVSEAELIEAYRGADLFVLPSVAEGFGQVLLEAMACGLPVLSTTHTAAPDLIREGQEGFIVPPGRPELLAERIAWAADNRGALQQMSLAARERAEFFTWQRFRSGVVAVYEQFAATAPEECRHV